MRRRVKAVLPAVLVTGLFALVALGPYRPDEAAVPCDQRAIHMAIELYRQNTGRSPRRMADLWEAPDGVRGWRGPYVRELPTDPWGNPYVYRHHAGRVYELLSYGADGLPGGAGEARDVVLRVGFETPTPAVDGR